MIVHQELNIYVHNLKGFDSHLLLNNLAYYDEPSVIPINKEQTLGIILQNYSIKDKLPKLSIMDSMRYYSFYFYK